MNITDYLLRIIVSALFWCTGTFVMAITLNFNCVRGSVYQTILVLLIVILAFLGCGWLMWVIK